MDITKTKKCVKCKKIKPRTEFYIRQKNPNWVQSECIKCINFYRKLRKEKELGRKLGKRSKLYTQEETNLLEKLYNSGTSYKEMLIHFPNRTQHALESKLSELGVASRVKYFRRRTSNIENLVKSWLIEKNINFIFQARIQNVVVDFKIGNLIVEVNGSYWHCDPKDYPNGPIYELQHANIEKDKLKKQLLIDLGYKIIYIWERDIEMYLDKIKSQLNVVLGSNIEDNNWPKSVELLRDNTEVIDSITKGESIP